MEQQIFQRLKFLSLSILLGIFSLTACKGQKHTAEKSSTELTDLKCYTQKVYPGVSGEIVYFAQYRVEFDLKTNAAVQFDRLIVGGRELTIQSVRQENKIINSSLGEHLDSDAENVRLNATLPMKQTAIKASDTQALFHPNEVTLVYQVEGNERTVVIEDIQNEPDQHRPAAPRGND